MKIFSNLKVSMYILLLGNTYSLKADKVDSALMLLESYRDKIKYDTKKKAWTIHRTYADDKVETTRSRNQNKDK